MIVNVLSLLLLLLLTWLLRFVDLYEATGELLGQGSQGAVHCYKSKKSPSTEYAVKVSLL